MQATKMKVMGRSATALAMGVALSLGSASLAGASSHHDNTTKNHDCASARVSSFDYANVGRGGYVTAVTATSVTVETWGGTSVTYTLTSTTTYTEGKSASSWASLVTGDRVNVQTSPAAPTTATSVNIELAELFGRVSGVNGNTITITGPQGFSRTIVVGNATTYVQGGASSNLNAVLVGSVIFAQGTIDANLTSLDALSITIGTAKSTTSPTTTASIRGVVTASTPSSVTVLSHDGTSTTFVFTTTTAFTAGKFTLSAASLANGEYVSVKVDTAAATTALSVSIKLARVSGTVSAKTSSTITVTGHRGHVSTIAVGTATTYTQGGTTASLTDVLVGSRVRAEGTVGSDPTTLNALSVDISTAVVVTPSPEPQQKGHHSHHGFGFGRHHDRH